MPRFRLAVALIVLAAPRALAADFPHFEVQEIDPHLGQVCYALTTADVNGDGKPDVVAVSENAVVWYENPSWRKHDIIRDQTKRDNVCIQAHDIDGDGRIDFVLGAGWGPPDTATPSTLQWIGRDGEGRWVVHPINYDEPTLHRLQWGDVKGNGEKQLIVAPLQGRGTKGPNWGEGQGVRVLAFDIPADPTQPDWPSELVDDSLHTIHNLLPFSPDGRGREQVLLAAWEGVFVLDREADGRWTKTQVGSGNQETQPFKGSSEIKAGRLADGTTYLATIEPWHGTQVVVYTPPKPDRRNQDRAEGGSPLWRRQVVAEPLKWGHALWCADLDGDGDDELIVGQRDSNPDGAPGPRGPGVYVFDPKSGPDGPTFDRHAVDEGGVACEDALAADLDGDGRPDIVAGGRATHNVRVYWNRPR